LLVSIERNRKPVFGSYTVERGVVTVTYGSRKKSAHLGGSPELTVARSLLADLVRDDSNQR